jgi:hypothetical protein
MRAFSELAYPTASSRAGSPSTGTKFACQLSRVLPHRGEAVAVDAVRHRFGNTKLASDG